MIGIHVDSMAAAASNSAKMSSLIPDLQKVLDLIDMGDVKWFLGMEITHNHKTWTVTLSQATYMLELRLQLYRKYIPTKVGIETRCGISALVLGVGFSSCAAPTFSDSPSISNTTRTRYESRDRKLQGRVWDVVSLA